MEKTIKLVERDWDSKDWDRCELEVEDNERGTVCLWEEHHLVAQIPFNSIEELRQFNLLLERMIKTYQVYTEDK